MGKKLKAKEIRVLDDHSNAEDADKVDGLVALLKDAEKDGCLSALKKHGHDVKYLTDPSRYSYIDLSGINSDEEVLEIGSSMGQHTRHIAKKCKTLSTIEVVRQQAELQALWCAEEGLENVDITAGGASGKLPFDDNSFDLIFFNYVLEWCAGRQEGAPEEFHKKFIQEIARVLKPGGRLYLSTKNRFAIQYVLGSVDEHLGIRFGHILPRFVQSYFRKRAVLEFPAGYLHSWNGLETILRSSGFSDCERLLAFPTARYPMYSGTFSDFDRSSIDTSKLGKRDRWPLKLPSPLFRFTTNSLVFLATLKK